MTNGDKIRSMTDEELTDFLAISEDRKTCLHCASMGKENHGRPRCIEEDLVCTPDLVREVWANWLASEAKA